MVTTIQYFDTLTKTLLRSKKTINATNYRDPIILAVKLSFNLLLLKNQVSIVTQKPSTETHYLSDFHTNFKITSVFTFGRVADTRYMNKFTETIQLSPLFSLSSSELCFNGIVPKITISYLDYGDNKHRIILAYHYGQPFNNAFANTIEVFNETARDAIQMIKCNSISFPYGYDLQHYDCLIDDEIISNHHIVARNSCWSDVEENPGPFQFLCMAFVNNQLAVSGKMIILVPYLRRMHILLQGLYLFICCMFLLFYTLVGDVDRIINRLYEKELNFRSVECIQYIAPVACYTQPEECYVYTKQMVLDECELNKPIPYYESEFYRIMAFQDEFKKSRDSTMADIEVNPGPVDRMPNVIHIRTPALKSSCNGKSLVFIRHISRGEAKKSLRYMKHVFAPLPEYMFNEMCEDPEFLKKFNDILSHLVPNKLQMFSGLIGGDIKQAQVQLESLTDVLQDLPDELSLKMSSTLKELGGTAITNIRQGGTFLICIVAAVYGVDFFMSGRKESRNIAMGCAVVAATLHGPEILSFITDLTKEQPQNEKQMFGGARNEWFHGVIDFIVNQMGLTKLKLKDLGFFVMNFERLRTGAIGIINYIFETIDAIAKYLLDMTVIPPEWYMGIEQKTEISEFFVSVKAFQLDCRQGKIPHTLQSAEILDCLIKRCVNIRYKIQKNSGASSVLDAIYNDLKGLVHRFGGVKAQSSGARPEPYSVVISGPPGVLKTEIVENLALRLFYDRKIEAVDANKYLDTKDQTTKARSDGMTYADYVFTKDFSKHEDGYRHQEVCRLDELGVQKDQPGMENNVYEWWIRAVNTVPFPLPMANLEDKGDAYFTSKYVFATTNIKEFRINSLEDPGAVIRRLHSYIFATVRREFCYDEGNAAGDSVWDRRPDFSKMPRVKDSTTGAAVIDPNIFELYDVILDRSNNPVSNRLIPGGLDELYERIVVGRKHREEIYAANLKSRSDFAAKKDAILSRYNVFPSTSFECEPGSIEDIPREFSLLRNFMALLESKSGVIFQNYDEFIGNFIRKYPEFMSEYQHGTGTDRWITLGLSEIKCVNAIEFESLAQLESLKTEATTGNKIMEFLKEHSYVIGAVSSIAMFFTFKSLFFSEEPVELQSPTKVVLSKQAPTKSMAEIQKEYAPVHLQMGIGADPNGDTLTDSIVMKNCFALCAGSGSGQEQRGQILFFAGTLAIMPAHFLYHVEQWVRDDQRPETLDTIFTLVSMADSDPDRNRYSLSIREFLSGAVKVPGMEDSELQIVLFPERIGAKRDIRKFFKRNSDFKKVYNQVSLKIFMCRKGIKFVDQQTATAEKSFEVVTGANGEKKIIPNSYTMRMKTADGHCGALVFEVNRAVPMRKILGLHVAGTPENEKAVTESIFAEWLDLAYDKVRSGDKPMLIDQFAEVDYTHVYGNKPLDWQMNGFVEVCQSRVVPSFTKSTWVKSRMYGLFQEATMKPALLHPIIVDGERIDPKVKALSKYSRKSGVHIDEEMLERCIESEIDFYNSNSPFYVEPRLLTSREALCGVADDSDSGPISRGTSPGAPYIFEKQGTKGKHLWLGSEGDVDMDNPYLIKFLNECDGMIKNMEKGIIPKFAFIDNLKDELRKLSKILGYDTRNFSACSFALNYICKVYLGSFIIYMLKNRIHNGHTIGINPYGREWDTMARALGEKNWWINAGDFKGFDTDHVPQTIQAMFPIIDAFYVGQTIEERNVRRCLWTTLYRTYHVVDDKVVLWDSSLPSGHPMTALINSMLNRVDHKLCFYMILCTVLVKTYDYFWTFNQAVVLFDHGDDSLFSCDPKYAEYYNENTLPEPMKILGLTYTPETKEVLEGRRRTIYEVTFLKRNFRKEKMLGRFVAPMDLTRLKEMINWTRKTDGDIILRDKCGLIAREFALHGKEKFNELIGPFNEGFRKAFGVGMDKTSWYQLFTEACCSTLTPLISNLQMNSKTSNYNEKALTNSESVCQLKNIMNSNFSDLPDLVPDDDEYDLVFQMNEALESGFTERTTPVGSNDTIETLDGPTEAVQPVGAVSDPGFLSDLNLGNQVDDIKRFLGRKVSVASGTFTSGDGATTFPIYDWSAPITTNAILTNKLLGIGFVRATLVIELEVNAEPFQQGLYCISYIPSGGMTGTSALTTDWRLMHGFSKLQISQAPIAYLNLGCDTKAVLKIPWKSAFNAWIPNVTTPTLLSPGSFRIYPFSSMTTGTGGNATCSYYMWAHYEDIELGGSVTPQMGKRVAFDMIGKEQSTPISSQLASLSTISSKLAVLPVIGQFAAATAWGLEAASKSAKYFGFSKPTQIEGPMKMMPTYGSFMACSDGFDVAEPLALTHGNHVALNAHTGSEIDELSIDFLKSIPSWFLSGTWAVATAQNTALIQQNVAPVAFVNPVADGSVNVTNFTPVGLLGTMFADWRGSLIFRIRLVKTKYHSGRLLCTMQYGDTDLATFAPVAIGNTPYNYRQIIDIREADEFDIEIPYMYKTPWCSSNFTGTAIGYFTITVLDLLRCPASANTTIQWHAEIIGGKDLQFAGVDNFGYTPIVPNAYQMNTCIATETTIGGTRGTDKHQEACEVSQGEMITSLRQLVKRYTPWNVGVQLGSLSNQYLTAPFSFSIFTSNGTVASGTVAGTTQDVYTLLASMYTFSRGGVRVLPIPATPSTTISLFWALKKLTSASAPLGGQFTAFVGSVANLLFTSAFEAVGFAHASNPGGGLLVPQNSTTLHRINGYNKMTVANGITYSSGYADVNQVVFAQTGSTVISYYMFRAGADDINFSGFVSIPPFYTLSAPA
jgi:hypothetical protein